MLVFTYDYQISKDIIRNICLKGSRVDKAELRYVKVDFYNGYIGFRLNGKDTLLGILFNFVLDDFKRFKQYVDLQYETAITDVTIYRGAFKKQAKVLIPLMDGKIRLPDSEYYDKLTAMYQENNFPTFPLEKALAKAFVLTYPDMSKYCLVKKKG